ncbi:MAG: RNB domain-containing ribonuclease, partial [Mycoplasma sp.]|nr:RNB domain-containing ribonuclease [Mycoplasma sp.]
YVKDILEKNNKTLVGVLIKNNDYVNFEPLNKKIIGQFIVEKGGYFNHDDIVKAEIVKVNKQYITIKIIKLLFNKNQDFSTTNLLIEENNLDLDFEPDLDNIAKELNKPILNKEKEKRIDLTNKLFVTIDGEDTKDFDDAILVEKLENNNFLLSVAISDVSYYVKQDSPLDQESYKRATSIYLLEKTIPMLPFHLSNGICSLSPNDERLVVVCQVEIDANGNERNIKLFRGVIKSKARLTYKQVNEFWFEKNINNISSSELQNMLMLAKQLSDVISKTQHEKGYINFQIQAPKI